MTYNREMAVALDAAQEAGRAIMDEYARFQAIPNAPADISTDADRLSQAIILEHLHAAFPDDALCAEEATDAFARVPQTGSRVWIVDPIDGTRGFARKNGEFSIMVALVEQSRLAVGVVSEPAKERLTYARQGGGCWKRDGAIREGVPLVAPTPCHVSSTSELSQATLVQSRSRNPNMPSPQMRALQPYRVLETYSAGIKLAMIARGEADVYLNTYTAFHDWDICAGHILVEEAGGRVTGLGGQKLQYGLAGAWQRYGVLANNGRLHDAAVQSLMSIRDQVLHTK